MIEFDSPKLPVGFVRLTEEEMEERKHEREAARTQPPPNAPTEPDFRVDLKTAAAELAKHVLEAEKAAQDEDEEGVILALKKAGRVRALVERIVNVDRCHYLKCDPGPFAEVKAGIKTFEVRVFDRDYRIGDLLVLQEYDRESRQYSGDKVKRRIVTILAPGQYGMAENVGVLGIAEVE